MRLIALTVETGCLTAFAAIANLVFFLALDSTNLYAMMYVPIYLSSLRYALKIRNTIGPSSLQGFHHLQTVHELADGISQLASDDLPVNRTFHATPFLTSRHRQVYELQLRHRDFW